MHSRLGGNKVDDVTRLAKQAIQAYRCYYDTISEIYDELTGVLLDMEAEGSRKALDLHTELSNILDE